MEQLRDREQSAALGYAMVCAQQHLMDGRHTLSQIVAELEAMLDEKGLESLCGGHSGVPFLARPGPRSFSPASTVIEAYSYKG